VTGGAVAVLALLAIAGLAPGGVAGAQRVALASGARTELDSATRAALTMDIARARARGLPVEPLLAKVREGQIKAAAPARIRMAVNALATRLDTARAALGDGATAEELSAGADALAAGASGVSLRVLRSAAHGRELAAPLGALAQLVASGVAPARATQLVVELLRRDAPASQLLAFGNAVESDVGAGVPAEESVQFRLRAFEAALGESRAGTSLGQTGDPGTIPLSGETGGQGRIRRKP
jgi:hypothetical protein